MADIPCKHEWTLGTHRDEVVVDGRTYTADLEADHCIHCQRVLIHGPSWEAFSDAVAIMLSVRKPFGEGFKRIRKSLGIMRSDIATQMGVEESTVIAWESGSAPIPTDKWSDLVGRLARIR